MNGIPIQLDHNADYADAPAKETRVGSTGDKARFEAPFLFNSLHILDKSAIDRINDGSMRELSLAYRYRPDFQKGTAPNGEEYDFIMRDINANHLALVEQGRCGDQVLVYDSKLEQTMYEDEKGIVPQETDIAEDEGVNVDALIKQMIDAGMDPEKAQMMRGQLEQLAGGETAEPVEAEDEDDSIDEEFDDEDYLEDDTEDMDGEELEGGPVNEESDSEDKPVETFEEDEEDVVEDEEEDDDDDLGEVEEGEAEEKVEPAPAEAPVQQQPQATAAIEGGAPQAEQVVKDAMAQCGLDSNDPAEARAFAAGVKFGEGELNKQQQPQQPIANPQQPQPKQGVAQDTNAIIRKVEARMNAKFKAIKECEKTLGKVEPTAYDSAGGVYLDALKQIGVRTTGLDAKAARAAYRAYFAGKKQEKKLAEDSAPKTESALAKVLNKIKVGA